MLLFLRAERSVDWIPLCSVSSQTSPGTELILSMKDHGPRTEMSPWFNEGTGVPAAMSASMSDTLP